MANIATIIMMSKHKGINPTALKLHSVKFCTIETGIGIYVRLVILFSSY